MRQFLRAALAWAIAAVAAALSIVLFGIALSVVNEGDGVFGALFCLVASVGIGRWALNALWEAPRPSRRKPR